MEQKTLEEVFSKKVNRILSIIYLILYAYFMVFSLVDAKGFISIVESVGIVFVVFELIKRCFYYIIAGTPFPLKDDAEYMETFTSQH